MSEQIDDRDALVRENESLRRRITELEADAGRCRTILYSIGDAIIVTDASGAVVQMNGVAETLTGWSELTARGRKLPEVFRIVNEDTLAQAENPVERALRDGTVVGLGNHTLLISKDAVRHPIIDSAAPIRDDAQNTTGVVLVFRDQTAERRAQAALHEAEEQFKAFFDNAPVGKSITALDGKLLRVNRAFGDMLGYSLEEMQQVSFVEITHPDDVAESRECIRALLAGECDTWTMDKRYIAKEGHLVWTHVVTRLQRDEQGIPRHFLTHIVDFTKLKLAEFALKESEQRQRRLYDSGLFGVIFWNMAGRILDANDKFLEMIGYTRDDLEAGRIDWVNMTPPEYHHLDIASVAELKATGVNRVPFEKAYLRKDGARLPILIAGAMLDADRINGVAFVLDITERKLAETQLVEQRTLLRNLLESAGDAIFSVNRDYCYTNFNSQHAAVMKAIYGCAIELGHSLFEYQRIAEDREQAKRNIDKALAGHRFTDEGYSGEDERVRAYFEVSHYPIRDDSDSIVGVAVFARDTTAKRRAEQDLRLLNAELDQRVSERTAELQASNRELDAFSYSVSHDLRAPLRAIDGFTQILLEECAPKLDAEGLRLCSVIRQNTGRMSRLIDDLLAFSRLGRAAMHATAIDMKAMAQDAFQTLTEPESRLRIDFTVRDLPRTVADPTLMRQVWTNLLSNAIKFSSKRERATIKVTFEEIDGECVYVVADNGAGFDMQYQDKLFGVFQRLHSTKEFDGTGVGLALVQRILRRHGGRVWAASKLDDGATFYFTLSDQGDPE
jgi:PAS domain S-box-containing protein